MKTAVLNCFLLQYAAQFGTEILNYQILKCELILTFPDPPQADKLYYKYLLF